MIMNKPNKCKNCQWYGKPYWSIINPCDNCPMENVETFTHWVDPTIEQKDKEIERLNNIIDELEKIIIDAWKIQDAEIFMTIHDKQYYTEEDVLNRIKELKEGK